MLFVRVSLSRIWKLFVRFFLIVSILVLFDLFLFSRLVRVCISFRVILVLVWVLFCDCVGGSGCGVEIGGSDGEVFILVGMGNNLF